MTYLTRNFTRKELQCPCCVVCEISPILLTRVQGLRDLFGPLVPASCCRCPRHNKKVGGKRGSKHLSSLELECQAIDIRIRNLTGARRHELIKSAFSLGFTGIGIGKTKLHLDVREGVAVSWGY